MHPANAGCIAFFSKIRLSTRREGDRRCSLHDKDVQLTHKKGQEAKDVEEAMYRRESLSQ